MKANNVQLNLNDDRRKEYQRQQEKLKAMGSTADKVKSVSADAMIETLLKDSFKKPEKVSPVEKPDNHHFELPPWLHCESPLVPSQYKHLWFLVQSTLDFADTQKVSQLLLTSGLHVDVLGFIWNLVNKAVPGQLTKQEFYIVLALVSLAQTGCAFNNLNVLKILPTPCIPLLQTSVLQNQLPQSFNSAKGSNDDSDIFQEFQSAPVQQSVSSINTDNEILKDQLFTNSFVKESNFLNQSVFETKTEKIEKDLIHGNICSKPNRINELPGLDINKGPYKNSNFPCIGLSPTADTEDDFTEFQSVPAEKPDATEKKNNFSNDSGDDFSEFQSANVENLDPFETVIITQKRDIPKITLPKTLSGKLTNLKSNILKISPESERKLKILSQPESLSSLPESKISSSNKVSTSISVLGSNHGIGSRLANHSLSAKLDRTKHHKHHKIKINPNPIQSKVEEEEIILGVRRTNTENLMPKCCPKKPVNCKTFILKETKIRSDEISEPSVAASEKNSNSPLHLGENTRQIEIPMLGTFNETILPTEVKPANSGVDLISVQEDKYSALRGIDLELNQEKIPSSVNLEENDDFGDFLSADIPPPLTAPSIPTESKLNSNAEILEPIPDLLSVNEEKDNWGEWNFSTEINSASLIDGNTKEKVEEPLSKIENDIFDSFNLVTLNTNENFKDGGELKFPEPLGDNTFNLIESSFNSEHVIPLSKKENIENLDSLAMFEDIPNEKANISIPKSKSDQLGANQSDNEFWEFLTSDVKTSPVVLSRQGSLPSLDFKVSPEETEQEVVWRKCLDSCQTLIQEGFEIFNNINIKSVLDEVFAAPKTSEYLNYLNIVFQISKRIYQNYNDFSSQEDLERLWGRLEELCYEYNIKLKQCEDNVSEGKVQCSICLNYVGSDSIKQGNGSYHLSCANLWVNFIEETLPYST